MNDYQIACCPDITLEEARHIADFGTCKAKRQLAQNPNCPLTVMWALSLEEDAAVREALAGNVQADDFLLNELLRDDSLLVRRRLAENVQLGETKLRRLMCDRDSIVAQKASRTFRTIQLERSWAV